MRYVYLAFCLGFCMLMTTNLHAQETKENLLAYQRNKLHNLYLNQRADMTWLIQGREHNPYYPMNEGNPFLFSQKWMPGNLQTVQYQYQNLPLRYDGFNDALLFLPDSFSNRSIWINPDLVVSFELIGKKFVYLGDRNAEIHQALASADLDEGYYELLYNEKSMLVARWQKLIKSNHNDPQKVGSFYERVRKFLLHNGHFYLIKKRKDIYQIFPRYKSDIRSYCKQNNIHIRRASHQQLVQLISYCDSL